MLPAGNPASGLARLSPVWWWTLGLVFACHLAWHLHGIREVGFQNLDVAGIAYNARLLLAGKLPYVQSIEIKPPAAFYLFLPWLALGGMRLVWVFSVFWATATSVTVGRIGSRIWGAPWGPRMAVMHAAGAALSADGDINYSFWMTLPVLLSVLAIAGALQKTPRDSDRRLWFGAGSAALLAVMIRPSAGTLALVFLVAMLQYFRQKGLRRSLAALLYTSAGAVTTLVLLLLPLMVHGGLEPVLRGWMMVSHYANDSVAAIVIGAGGRLPATFIGLQCLPDQLPAFHLLLALALVPGRHRPWERERHPLAWLPWLFGLSMLAGISLTLRFFTHDNAPLWPAYVLVALRPTGLLGRLYEVVYSRRGYVLSLSLLIGLATTASGWRRLSWLQGYMAGSDRRVAAVCDVVRPALLRGDTVLAWGWSAWGVYEHCRRWAPGPIYKDLTTVTTPNTNTCNRGYEPPRFKQGPLAVRYLEDLKQSRPALVVVSDYYKGLGGDPLDEWHEARLWLRANYVTLDTVPGFQFLVTPALAERLGHSDGRVPALHVVEESTVNSACGVADQSWQSVGAIAEPRH